jgi:glutathione synthase/RimK-type ligase-like ATP-grasp enzyme
VAKIVTAECFDEAIAQYKNPNSKEEDESKHNKEIDQNASKFISNLRVILLTNNKFFDFIHAYFLTLVSDKSHEVTNHLLSI